MQELKESLGQLVHNVQELPMILTKDEVLKINGICPKKFTEEAPRKGVKRYTKGGKTYFLRSEVLKYLFLS